MLKHVVVIGHVGEQAFVLYVEALSSVWRLKMYCDRKVNISDQKVHPFLRVFWSFLSEYDYVQWNTCVHDSPNMATSSQVWLVGLEA